MIPEIQSFCHYSLEGEDRARNGKVVKIVSLEVRVSRVWEERGELVVWLVKFKGICKIQTAGSPESPGPASIQAKNKGV